MARTASSILLLTLRRPPTSIKSFVAFGNDRVAVVIQPVDQPTDRQSFPVVDDRVLVERAQQCASASEFLEEQFVVDVKALGLGRCKPISAVNKERNSS